MTDKEKKHAFTEGQVKKGGINLQPTTQKPNVKPSGQKPKSEKP